MPMYDGFYLPTVGDLVAYAGSLVEFHGLILKVHAVSGDFFTAPECRTYILVGFGTNKNVVLRHVRPQSFTIVKETAHA